jgi:AcrR family transcriptional regulator
MVMKRRLTMEPGRVAAGGGDTQRGLAAGPAREPGSARDSRPARERILDTAAELFYRDGYGAVGVDTIIEHAGVAKMTLYRNFASKDELIVAYLERANERFWDWFDGALADAPEDPREKLVGLFDAVAKFSASPACLGCTFQATAGEFPSPDHPGHRFARAHKNEVLRRLRELAAEARARDPERLAQQLMLVMDGAWAAARMFGIAGGPAPAAATAARALLEAELG